MRRAGRVVAEMHSCIREAIRPGVTTAELDRIGRDVIERRGARSNFLGYGHPPFSGVICASPERRHRPRHPRPGPARRGRHRLDRLRGDRRGLARRRRLHRRGGGDRPGGRPAHRGDRGIAGRRDRGDGPRRPSVRHRRRRAGRGRGGRVLGGAGVHGPRHRHGHARAARRPQLGQARQGPQAGPGPDLRRRAHGLRRPADTRLLDDQWTVVTADGRRAAHTEHTIAITDDGPEILTLP